MKDKIYHPIDSLTSGLIEGYPKTIYMAEFDLKVWGLLNTALKQGEMVLSAALTGALDKVIDFDKTGFIKTSDDLTLVDRKKLFFWQKIQTDFSTFTVTYTCPKDGNKFDEEYNILEFTETFITKVPKVSEFIDRSGNKVYLTPFTKRTVNEYDKILINFIEAGVDIEKEQYSLKLVPNPDVEGKKMVETDDWTTYLLTLYSEIKFIDNHPEALASLTGYLDYIYENFNKKELTYLENWIMEIYHDITQTKTIKCTKEGCDFSSEEDVPSALGFFLGLY